MDAQCCGEHSGMAATHRCDGCGRLLCPECIEVGHRLLTRRQHEVDLEPIYLR